MWKSLAGRASASLLVLSLAFGEAGPVLCHVWTRRYQPKSSVVVQDQDHHVLQVDHYGDRA